MTVGDGSQTGHLHTVYCIYLLAECFTAWPAHGWIRFLSCFKELASFLISKTESGMKCPGNDNAGKEEMAHCCRTQTLRTAEAFLSSDVGAGVKIRRKRTKHNCQAEGCLPLLSALWRQRWADCLKASPVYNWKFQTSQPYIVRPQ